MSSAAIISVGNGVEGKSYYPVPLASHDDVVKDSSVFWDTLRRFHRVTGTKFVRVPVIGGQELNLHVLYAEVTKRGGFGKVVTEKKWREVSSAFTFSAKATSASYALRKHYWNYLYHYENAYFLGLQSPPVSPTQPPTDSQDPPCFHVKGTIQAKFDYGYLVSVQLGSEIVSGVIYHPKQPVNTEPSSTSIVPYNNGDELPCSSGLKKRRRRKKRGGDPARPKPNRSGYNFFFAEKHSKLKSLYPEREREFTKMIGESWNGLSLEERMVYQKQGLEDKERYQREMKEYKERLAAGDG